MNEKLIEVDNVYNNSLPAPKQVASFTTCEHGSSNTSLLYIFLLKNLWSASL